MNQRSAFVLVAVGLVLGLGERVADAGLVTWQFGGEITLIDDPDNALGIAITVGTPFSGSFTFESSTPDSDPSVAIGRYNDSATAISGSIGAFAFSGSDGFDSQIRITDSPGGDSDIFGLSVQDVIFSDFGEAFSFSLGLGRSDGALFTTDALPLFPPDLGAVTTATVLFLGNRAGADIFITGDLSVLVPEPGSLALLAFGALLMLKRKRSSRSFGVFGVVLVMGVGLSSDLRAQQWDPDWGPVIIGGDDLDDHRTTIGIDPPVLMGDAFIREGFKFLAANVKNGKTVEGLVL